MGAYSSEERERIAKESEDQQNINPILRGGSKQEPKKESLAPLKRSSCHMKYYHFLPVFRYYVVIKEREADDVEAIFRVNSLSSFSLGIAQLVGLLFSYFFGEQFGIFHYINIGSQAINWGITFLYFTTPISALMKNSMNVEAMKAQKDEWLRKKHREWDSLVEQASAANEPSLELAKSQFVERIDKHIIALSGTNGNIDQEEFKSFEMEWKFQVLKKLNSKLVAEYGSVC